MGTIREKLLVKPGAEVRLDKIDPDGTPGCDSKDEGIERFNAHGDRLSVLQYLLYAEARRSVLVILQGIDAGGKDGTIRKVMSGLNPQGVHVTSFKAPAGIEREHDYLWRVHKAVPRFGQIGIFNRSHYEDVLIARVRGLVEEKVWSRRYKHINAFEEMLADEGTTIVKFFLYISKDEQKKRFEERIQDPEKHWKFNPADIEERKYWDDYIEAYKVAIERSSKPHAPWYIIPANRKWYRNLAVSEILRETLEEMDIQVPGPVHDLSRIKFE
jgi:PPK2 family polyphosphate:nucleotide phosphotransferase